MNFHVAWELTFTDFAFKLSKIIMLGSSHDIFLHLYPDPLGEALKVYSSTRTVTLARVKKEIVLFVVVLKTNFTGITLLGWIVNKLENIFIE